MDCFEQLIGRCRVCVVALVVVAALVAGACDSGIRDGSPKQTTSSTREATTAPVVSSEMQVTTTSPAGSVVVVPPEPWGVVVVPPFYELTVVVAMGLQEGIGMLDPGDAEVFEFHPGIPDDLPAVAYRVAVFGRGEHADPPRRPEELIVATHWPRAVRANVLCLVDGVQVPCSEEAAVWRVELDEPELAFLSLPDVEGRRDIVFVEERDGRPEGVLPVSGVRSVDGWDVPFSALGDPPPVIQNPLGGCDWVVFMDSLDQREDFKPMKTRPLGPVYLVISVCPDQPSYEMRPIVVVDETTVAQVDAFQPFLAEPGMTYAWKVPNELLNAGNQIRGAAVRRAGGAGAYWITHPLATTRHGPPW